MSGSSAPPYALLWSPIPIITWLMPFIGHMGVSSSSAVAVDFAGPYMVHEDEDGVMIFGAPTRYMLLDPHRAYALTQQKAAPRSSGIEGIGGVGGGSEAGSQLSQPELDRWWDAQLEAVSCSFRNQSYNILGNNCHALASSFLNQIKYNRSTKWNMIHCAALMFLCGRYTSFLGFLLTWVPFAIIAGLGAYFGRLYFLYAWLGITVPLVLWFVIYVYGCSRSNPEKP